ncbi:MAG: serine hydrolase [Pseudomonadota bacterium]
MPRIDEPLIFLSFKYLVAVIGVVLLPISLLNAETATSSSFAQLDKAINEGQFGDVTSIVVERNAEIVHERYFEGDATTLRDTRSATKTIASFLVGTAIQDEALTGVDQRVFEALGLPDHANPDPRKTATTLKDLLSMTSVFECNDWNSFSRGNEERMYLVEDWTKFFVDLPVRGIPPWEPPASERAYGRAHSYCTAGVYILGRVTALATNQSIEEYAQQKLFGPLGIETLQWQYSPKGYAQTGGGLRLSSIALARLGRMHLDQGLARDGTRVLTESWIKESVEPQARIDEDDDYGYLWWIKRPTKQAPQFQGPYMSGNGGNRVHLLPELNAVVVITTKNFGQRDAHSRADRIMADFVIPALLKRGERELTR